MFIINAHMINYYVQLINACTQICYFRLSWFTGLMNMIYSQIVQYNKFLKTLNQSHLMLPHELYNL